MESLFDFAHLDPSCNPPEGYVAAFGLLAACWCELRALRSACPADEFLSGFTAHLGTELVRRRSRVSNSGRTPDRSLAPSSFFNGVTDATCKPVDRQHRRRPRQSSGGNPEPGKVADGNNQFAFPARGEPYLPICLPGKWTGYCPKMPQQA